MLGTKDRGDAEMGSNMNVVGASDFKSREDG
jgi:hypothetical protein